MIVVIVLNITEKIILLTEQSKYNEVTCWAEEN